MTKIARAGCLSLGVGLALAIVTSAARAVEPSPADLIGGRLSAGGGQISVTSNSTSRVVVTMAASDVTLSITRLALDPGATGNLSYTGGEVGSISARFDGPAVTGGDRASATLSVNLKPPVARTEWPILPIIAALCIVLLVVRFRPWRYRLALSRKG